MCVLLELMVKPKGVGATVYVCAATARQGSTEWWVENEKEYLAFAVLGNEKLRTKVCDDDGAATLQEKGNEMMCCQG